MFRNEEESESDKIFRLRVLVFLTVRLRLLPKISDRLRNPATNRGVFLDLVTYTADLDGAFCDHLEKYIVVKNRLKSIQNDLVAIAAFLRLTCLCIFCSFIHFFLFDKKTRVLRCEKAHVEKFWYCWF